MAEVDAFLAALAREVAALRGWRRRVLHAPQPAVGASTALTAVAMSGGLDSSVAAWLLARAGEPVVGLSMLLWDQLGERVRPRPLLRRARPRRRAAGGAAGRHPPLHAAHGRRVPRDRSSTPSSTTTWPAARRAPACAATPSSSSTLLLERARALGAARVATGHYARILDGPDGPELHTRASTRRRTRATTSSSSTQEQLAASLFPLGEHDQARGARRSPARPAWWWPRRARAWRSASSPAGSREFVEAQAAARPERFAGAAAAPRPAAPWSTRPAQSSAAASPTTATPWASAAASASPPAERALRAARSSPRRTAWWSATRGAARARPRRRAPALDRRPPPPAGGEVEATVKIRSRHPGVAARIRPLGASGARRGRVRRARSAASPPARRRSSTSGTRVLGGCWISGPLS